MSFIQDNAVLFISVAVLIASYIFAYVVVPYLNKRGILTKDNVKQGQEILDLTREIFMAFNVKDENKQLAEKVFHIAEKSVHYIEQTMNDSDNTQKKQSAVDIAADILEQMGIQVDSKILSLLEIGIEAAVHLLPKTKDSNIIQPLAIEVKKEV
jgi:hypothetical protein